MTTSTIIQTIVALGIVAVALVYVLRRVVKTSRGQGDCGCGCGKNCICPPGAANNCEKKRATPGSISFVPSVVGLILAGYVVRSLTGVQPQRGA